MAFLANLKDRIKSWLRKRVELFPLMNRAHIYYSQRGILISSEVRDVTGLTGPGLPITLLPLDSKPMVIGEHIFSCLQANRDGISEEELKALSQAFFQTANVKNWDQLERENENIGACINPKDNLFYAYRMHRYETGGYVSCEGDPHHISPVEIKAIGEIIRKIIDAPPLEVIPHEESHT